MLEATAFCYLKKITTEHTEALRATQS